PTGYQLMPGENCVVSVPKTSSLCIFRSLEPSVRTLTPLKWRSVLTVKPNVINRLLKTRSIMQERQGAEREVQCLLKIGILARDRQAADGWLGKARSGGDEIGPNPTDRAKNGTKKSVLTDAVGGPLSIVIAPANVNDHKLLEVTIEAMVIERPEPTERAPQNLCLDKGYDNKPSREVVKKHCYRDHIRRIGEEKLDREGKKKHPARRYVVERTLAWLSKCRGLLVRYERKSENYLAQLQFACALLWYRRLPNPATAFP